MASDIKLSVDLEAGDVKQAASELQAELRKVFGAGVSDESSQKFMRLQMNIDKAYKSAESLKNQMATLESTSIPTEAYTEVDNHIQKTKADLDKLIERMDKFIATGGKTNSKAFRGMQYDAEQLKNTLMYLEGEMQDLMQSGQATVPASSTTQYQALVEKLAQVNNQMRIYKAQAASIAGTGSGVSQETVGRWESLRQSIGKATTAVREFARNAALNTVSRGLEIAGSSAQGLATSLKRAVGTTTLGRFTSLGDAFSGMSGGLGNFTGGLKKGFWSVMKYGLGLRSLFVITNKVRNALKDGIKNLVQYSGSFNKSISGMLSSLTYLKNSLATAFEPLITAVAPIIVNFIDTIANAISKISQLFSALIGRSFYYKAKKVYQDYAASLSSNSEKANKSAEKLQRTISGFDDIEILKEADKSDSSGGGGGGYTGPGPGDMFEKAAVTEPFQNMAELIKEAWKNADFTEIGRIVGEKTRDALESIPWDGIKKQAKKIAKSIATFINGYVETPGLWEAVGKTAAEGVNTALEFANSFLKNIHTDSIGKAITTAISSFFKNIDWSLLGNTISNAFARLFDYIRGLIQGINWRQLPMDVINAIKDFLVGFDWKEFFSSLGELIGSIAAAAIDFGMAIAELFNKLNKAIYDWFSKHIEEAKESGKPIGIAIIEGIFNGIVDIIKSIGTWIYDNIIKPFVAGFQKGFQIHSPSKLMAEQGKYVIEGLLDGIINTLLNIASWVKTNIIDKIIDGIKGALNNFIAVGTLIGNAIKDNISIDKLKEVGTSAINMIKSGIEGAKSILTSIGGTIGGWIKDNINVDKFKEAGSSIVNNIQSGITAVKNVLTTVGGNIKTWVQNNINIDKFKDAGSSIGNNIQKGISAVKTNLTDIGKSIREWVKDNISASKFKDTGESIGNKVKDGIANIKKGLQTVGGNVRNWVKNNINASNFKNTGESIGKHVVSGISNLKKSLLNIGATVKNWISSKLAPGQTFINIGKNIVNGIINGMKKIARNIGNTVKNISKKIADGFKSFFGIHSPSRLMRDEVGKMLMVGLAEGISNNSQRAISEMTDVANSLMESTPNEIPLPDITAGKVIPYDIEASNKQSIENVLSTLKNLIEMLEYTQDSQIDRDTLAEVLTKVVREYLNISFYLGDEQVARHANKGNQLLNQRYNPVLT